MSELTSEGKIYSEFLTNLAVAWFAAGVIGPLFTFGSGPAKFISSLVGLTSCFVSLRLAVAFTQGEKND